jgi:hypothetical protein
MSRYERRHRRYTFTCAFDVIDGRVRDEVTQAQVEHYR